MTDPLISFVVPAYNAASTIRDTLGSLLGQTRPEWEAIVVDDGSTDATVRSTDVNDDRISIVSQRNRGLAGARNRGFRDARGDRVCFLDADDRVHPRFVERMAPALSDHDLVTCAHRMVGPGMEDLGWSSHPGDADAELGRMLSVNPFVVGAVVMRRNAPGRLGLDGPFDETLPVHEDWDLWLRMTGAGASWAPVVTETLFDYRIRPGSMSGDLDLMWRTGMRVIGGAPAGVEEVMRARRQWTIRSLARSVARGDLWLTGGLRAFLGEVSSDEIGLLASSLRWALQREDVVGPGESAARAPQWRSRIEAMLEGCVARRVIERLDLCAHDWDAMARALMVRRASGQRIVLYGLGRNGRALLTALQACPGFNGVAYIDDDPSVHAPGAMATTVKDLRPTDLVVVTPNDARPILDRLQCRGVTLVDLSSVASASA